MVFYKMIQMVDASDKYGDGQQMMVAAEPIAAGEKICGVLVVMKIIRCQEMKYFI